jgi:hypothetical protein
MEAEAFAQCQMLQYLGSDVRPAAAAVVAAVAVQGDVQEDEADSPAAAQQWARGLVQRELPGLAAAPQHSAFFAGQQQGVMLVELFGGLCAGLEACLRNGWVVHRYLYVDKDPAVRGMAAHRLALLRAQYPCQLSSAACAAAFTSWPQDVTALGQQHVQQLWSGGT